MKKFLISLSVAMMAVVLSGCAGGGGATGSYKVTAFKPKNPGNVKVKVSTSTQNIYVMEGDIWIRAFLALGTIFLTTASFTLAKCVRDAQEEQYVLARLDRARLDHMLAEHDPFHPQI